MLLTAIIHIRPELSRLTDAHDGLTTRFTVGKLMMADRAFVVVKPLPVGGLIEPTTFSGVGHRIEEIALNIIVRQGNMAYPGVVGHQEDRMVLQVIHD